MKNCATFRRLQHTTGNDQSVLRFCNCVSSYGHTQNIHFGFNYMQLMKWMGSYEIEIELMEYNFTAARNLLQ